MPFVKGWITTALVGSEQTLDGQAADIDGEREAGTLFIEVLCLADALRRRLEIVLWRELHSFRLARQVLLASGTRPHVLSITSGMIEVDPRSIAIGIATP